MLQVQGTAKDPRECVLLGGWRIQMLIRNFLRQGLHFLNSYIPSVHTSQHHCIVTK